MSHQGTRLHEESHSSWESAEIITNGGILVIPLLFWNLRVNYFLDYIKRLARYPLHIWKDKHTCIFAAKGQKVVSEKTVAKKNSLQIKEISCLSEDFQSILSSEYRTFPPWYLLYLNSPFIRKL